MMIQFGCPFVILALVATLLNHPIAAVEQTQDQELPNTSGPSKMLRFLTSLGGHYRPQQDATPMIGMFDEKIPFMMEDASSGVVLGRGGDGPFLGKKSGGDYSYGKKGGYGYGKKGYGYFPGGDDDGGGEDSHPTALPVVSTPPVTTPTQPPTPTEDDGGCSPMEGGKKGYYGDDCSGKKGIGGKKGYYDGGGKKGYYDEGGKKGYYDGGKKGNGKKGYGDDDDDGGKKPSQPPVVSLPPSQPPTESVVPSLGPTEREQTGTPCDVDVSLTCTTANQESCSSIPTLPDGEAGDCSLGIFYDVELCNNKNSQASITTFDLSLNGIISDVLDQLASDILASNECVGVSIESVIDICQSSRSFASTAVEAVDGESGLNCQDSEEIQVIVTPTTPPPTPVPPTSPQPTLQPTLFPTPPTGTPSPTTIPPTTPFPTISPPTPFPTPPTGTPSPTTIPPTTPFPTISPPTPTPGPPTPVPGPCDTTVTIDCTTPGGRKCENLSYRDENCDVLVRFEVNVCNTGNTVADIKELSWTSDGSKVSILDLLPSTIIPAGGGCVTALIGKEISVCTQASYTFFAEVMADGSDGRCMDDDRLDIIIAIPPTPPTFLPTLPPTTPPTLSPTISPPTPPPSPPTPPPGPCDTTVKMVCTTADGQMCEDLSYRNENCDVLLSFEVKVCNTGDTVADIMELNWTFNGATVSILSSLPSDTIPAGGGCLTAFVPQTLNLCAPDDFTFLVSVMADGSDGACMDYDRLDIHIKPTPTPPPTHLPTPFPPPPTPPPTTTPPPTPSPTVSPPTLSPLPPTLPPGPCDTTVKIECMTSGGLMCEDLSYREDNCVETISFTIKVCNTGDTVADIMELNWTSGGSTVSILNLLPSRLIPAGGGCVPASFPQTLDLCTSASYAVLVNVMADGSDGACMDYDRLDIHIKAPPTPPPTHLPTPFPPPPTPAPTTLPPTPSPTVSPPTSPPLPPTPPPGPCDTTVKIQCSTPGGEMCEDLSYREDNCNETITFNVKVCNTGDTVADIMELNWSSGGSTVTILNLLPSRIIPAGGGCLTTANIPQTLDLCTPAGYTVLVNVMADGSDGVCMDYDRLDIYINPPPTPPPTPMPSRDGAPPVETAPPRTPIPTPVPTLPPTHMPTERDDSTIPPVEPPTPRTPVPTLITNPPPPPPGSIPPTSAPPTPTVGKGKGGKKGGDDDDGCSGKKGGKKGYYEGDDDCGGKKTGYYGGKKTGYYGGKKIGYYGGKKIGYYGGKKIGYYGGKKIGYYGGKKGGKKTGYSGGKKGGKKTGYNGGKKGGKKTGYYGGEGYHP